MKVKLLLNLYLQTKISWFVYVDYILIFVSLSSLCIYETSHRSLLSWSENTLQLNISITYLWTRGSGNRRVNSDRSDCESHTQDRVCVYTFICGIQCDTNQLFTVTQTLEATVHKAFQFKSNVIKQ